MKEILWKRLEGFLKNKIQTGSKTVYDRFNFLPFKGVSAFQRF